jgi:two-component system, NarL family, nitrate/nitrite sensor histidine kinase NarX
MRSPHTLATKLVLTGSALLVLALLSIGLTLWVSWQIDGGGAAVNEGGRLRMQTWRLAATLGPDERESALAQARAFDASLALLRDGDASRPLSVPWDAATRTQFQATARAWDALKAEWLAAAPPSPAAVSRQAGEFVDRIDGLVAAIEHSLTAWTAILSLSQMAMVALAIASALALLYAGHVFVLQPLEALGDGLARVQRGDLSTRVALRTRDEFGALADGFNRMAETLQGLYGELEFKVREKTAHLELERQRLATLYAASEFLARAQTLDEMAQGFVGQVRRIAGADAAAIRWSDESNQRYVLLAGDCLPQAIVDGEHCVRTGDCLCGQAQEGAHTRVIPIRPDTPAPMDHCAQAGFQSIVSVPVTLQQRTLGEIDLFFYAATRLDDQTRQHLDALASHLASAMEGLRAEALQRESAVAEERSLLARELHDSIAQSLAFLKIQVQLLRDASRRQDAVAVERTLGELDTGVRESTADVRELLVHFRTRTNGEDILPALRTTLRKFEHQTGLSTTLEVEGDGLPLPPDVQVQVLHVIQEALSNVRKHASARQVWVELQQGPQWRVEVRDDGQGFDPAQGAADETHVGLRIMTERAARIGAQVQVDSVPGAGTCVVLTLPTPVEAIAA